MISLKLVMKIHNKRKRRMKNHKILKLLNNNYKRIPKQVLHYYYNYYYKVDSYYLVLVHYINKNLNKLYGQLFMLVYIIRVKRMLIVEY